MDYIYITEKDKAIIVENQLKELEGNHFALSLIEPSKFQQQDQHVADRSARAAPPGGVGGAGGRKGPPLLLPGRDRHHPVGAAFAGPR